MKITKPTSTLLVLSVLLFCGTGRSSDAKDVDRQSGKPNVLFIAIDDLNDWTGMLKGNPQARKACHVLPGKTQGPDRRVQRMMTNVFDRFIG